MGCSEKMKIAQIAGFLGSGKTTLLIEVAKVLVEQGKKVAIVVNDVGEINCRFQDRRFLWA